MRTPKGKATVDDLRPEYDLSALPGGVRGKYYKRAITGSNIVVLDPDVADAFPTDESVNQALRAVLVASAQVKRSRKGHS
ncbi:MAG TPA: hypothetical protein VKF32_05445 [Thermoanaerobaculia bacterium]|nr:hypothetical protein [Thermoanaerobaculia bacterium]